jgi:hypothetical protein
MKGADEILKETGARRWGRCSSVGGIAFAWHGLIPSAKKGLGVLAYEYL